MNTGSRIMVPNTGAMPLCQGNLDNYTNGNISQGCSTVSHRPPHPTQFASQQHNQTCCDTHQCYSSHHHRAKMMHQPMRFAFGAMNRPSFCRIPGMAGSQNSCMSQHPMQQFTHHQMMVGNRLPAPIANNTICRLPINGAASMPMLDNGNVSQGNNCQISLQESFTSHKTSQPEEGEKRRRGNSSRAKKKAKLNLERISPSINVDIRNLRSENAISPHTGPGPPLHSASVGLQNSSNENQVEGFPPSSEVSSASQGSLPVSGPSFMEDPNGYLAQQTVLLNNTMSGGGVGQFSPQGCRLSPRPSTSLQNLLPPPIPPKGPNSQNSVSSDLKTSASPAVVPLPSNVPLPARVSKANSNNININSASYTCSASSASGSLCSSVHSKSWSGCLNNNKNCNNLNKSRTEALESQEKANSVIATAESSCIQHTVTVTYTTSSVTTTCGSLSNSPQSSQEAIIVNEVLPDDHAEIPSTSETETHICTSSKISKISSSNSSDSPPLKKIDSNSTKSVDVQIKTDISDSFKSSTKSRSGSNLSPEAANKPLTPGPAESTMATQSPLEMVQNIVSSIPLPASSEDLNSLSGKPSSHHSSQLVTEQPQSIHNLPQAMTGPHVYSMTGGNNVTGVMYNPGGNSSNMIRGPTPLVLHGAAPAGSIPPGVFVSNSGNMVVVTSPFNTKVSMAAPVVCSNVSGLSSMVGVQAVPQVQVQPSLANVQSHQLQSHLQQIQPVQPVVQFVNTFATMQAPVIIQNGSNIIQSPSGVISGPGGVIGPTSIIPSSSQTFVTSQPLLAVDSSTHSSHVQVTHVVPPATSEGSDDSSGNRLTPVATPASTPTTPLSNQGSEASPSGSSTGSGRKRKRRRNTSTPQNSHQQSPQQHLVPAIIMGKQIPQQMVVSGSQISQVAPYGNLAGTQVATVATVSGNGTVASGNQMLTTTGQAPNSINVVQMVGGPVTGPLPVHVQHPHTILVPSTAAPAPGVLINQLPDGTFVSTDPSSGVSYPVQLQISGSHIVGVTPLGNPNSNPGGVTSVPGPSSIPQGTVVAVRHPHSSSCPTPHTSTIGASAKIIRISPGVSTSQPETLVSNVYGVSACPNLPPTGIITAPVEAEFNSNSSASLSHHVPQGNQNEENLHSVIVGNTNATLLQRKTTTIVAQQTTVVATQGGLMGTHSSVSTQTPGLIGENDVSSSDCVASSRPIRDVLESPSHQSAEVTTTRQDEDMSTPESVLVSPQGQSSPESSKRILSSRNSDQVQEPHSASAASTGTFSISNFVFFIYN